MELRRLSMGLHALSPRVKRDGALALALIGLCVAARLLPHAPNFTPLAAAALFAGAMMRDVRLAVATPAIALIVSDVLIGFYNPLVMAAVYVGLLAPVLLGRTVLADGIGAFRLPATALGAAVLFFMVSNLAVWATSPLYPLNGAGLAACFIAALPFFKYTLAGNLVWSAALFGAAHLAKRVSARSA